ncbi:SID1 transmembrane family member 1-like isoform X5 [Lytechinus pictus]|uniref:SID1 transmembrane family member 1-like isoform X5 n=1 Tax=Lytechinus pictus TaxID=7653 RepID=UPI0030B9BF25
MRSVLSWTVPYVSTDGQKYGSVSKTLCPDASNRNTSMEETIIVVVSTSSAIDVSFTLLGNFVGDFNLQSNRSITFSSNPSAPQYYQYEFPEGVDMVLVKAHSENSTCAYLSVQNAQCPIFDDFSTVRYNEGIFQTMTKQAAITVTRDMYKSGFFYVVVVVHPNDNMCDNNYRTLTPLEAQYSGSSPRTKIVTLRVKHTLETHDYWKPIVTTFGVILAIYFLSGFIIAGNIMRQKKADMMAGTASERVVLLDPESNAQDGQMPFAQADSASSNYGTAERQSSPSRIKPDSAERIIASSDDETDIDMLDDIESTKEVYRTKTELYVSDLSRKKVNTLEKKYNMYAWNLITVSVFYALPVVQLVITYQVVTNVTGNQDSCYYNFLCAKPYGWFSAFNNVFSNTGYVMLGILFLLLVWRKEYAHKKRVHAGYKNELTHGIPKHYGLLYALGYALIMEGIMSGSYHVCPNRANYQFDTAYMYMIACLGMLKMYQQRHPDINANSYKSFALFAVILFIGFLGLVSCSEEW